MFMSRWNLTLGACALALAVGGSVMAADGDEKPKKKGGGVEARFKMLDKNGDGKLSLEEYKGKAKGDKATKAEGQFKKLDKDGDGSLTLEEFKGAGGGKKKADK